jgi:hypothetical protein
MIIWHNSNVRGSFLATNTRPILRAIKIDQPAER